MSRVPIPTDWDGETYCCRIVQWPDSASWTAILLGLISWPMRGRFWDERTGTVTDVQAIGDEIYDINVTDGGCILGCIEDLASKLDDIVEALQGLGGVACGCPSGATGTVPDPGTTIGGDAGDAPSGYEEELYGGDDKCSVANWYWQQTLDTLQALLDYNVIGWLAQGITLAIAAILAVVALPALAIFGSVLLSQLAAMTDLISALLPLDNDDLQDMIDAIDADQAGFVCALWTGEDVGGSQQNIEDWAQAAGFTAAQDVLLIAILNNYVLAGLYYLKQSVLDEADAMTGKYNCSECVPAGACPFFIQYGSGTILYDGTEFTLASEFAAGYHFLNIGKPCTCEEEGDPNNWCVEITAYTIDDVTTSFNRVARGYNAACDVISKGYNTASPSMPPLDTPLCVSALEFTDDASFTVTYKINGPTGALGAGEDPENQDNC